jgi:acyl-CoA synthetase (AMP-forming)/AMP-acid ligase II
VVAALVVTTSEAPKSVEAIRNALEPRLSAYKLPRRVAVVGALPTFASGKLDRAGARTLAESLLRPIVPPPRPRRHASGTRSLPPRG